MADPPTFVTATVKSLHALVYKADRAVTKSRWARAADLYKRAALQASVLYPHDSLVTLELRYFQTDTMQSQAREPGVSSGEQRALQDEAWCLFRGKSVVW